MIKDLIINVSASEVSIALHEDKQLVELHTEKERSKFAVGDIYLGRVKKVMPGLNAAFIDVGSEKDAFLHYQDLGPQFASLKKFVKASLTKKSKTFSISKFKNEPDIDKNGKIADVLSGGDLVVVQIVKEPISTKGPRLCSEISLAGRHMVVMPFSNKVSISQKIESLEERQRLKSLIQSIKQPNFGVIIRTVAEQKKVATFDSELKSIIKKWDTAFENLKENEAPKLLISEVNRLSVIIRDHLNGEFNSIVVNDEDAYNELKEYISTIAPEKEKIIKLYDSSTPIFDHFGIEKQIKSLFGKTVSVRNGSYLIIEHTEALHVIDVNSGNRSRSAKDQETNAFETNLAAAQEIARQLRLRDMGGIIVVDFIDMRDNEHKQQLFEQMKKLMESQKAKHNILPLSKFGLMQITRQRVRPEMNIDTSEKCPTCKGTGVIQSSIMLEKDIENAIASVASKKNQKIILRVHPYIASYLTKGILSIRLKWAWKYQCRIKIESKPTFHLLDYKIETPDNTIL